MAAPADKTLKNLSGKWNLNKTISDSAEDGLSIQGIGYLVRKGINFASISIDVNQFEAPPRAPSADTDNVWHIEITQTTAGVSTTHENRCIDDVPRDSVDKIFGDVTGRSKWLKMAEIQDEFLKKGWDAEDDETLFQSHVVSRTNGWTAVQIWGFQTIDGQRRYCRNIVISKGDKRATFRFVYDYEG